MDKIKQTLYEQRDDHLTFLKKLIACDTAVTNMGKGGHESAGQQIVVSELRRLGAKIDMFEPDNAVMHEHAEWNPGHEYTGRPNVVGTFPGTGGGASLMFNAHIDVVPTGDPASWTSAPFSPEERDGKLFGRGSCDMKAGGAAALMALETLHRCGIKLRGDVLFESVVDEEGGGNGTLACCLKGYRADAAIIPEPSELTMMPAHMGWLFYRIRFSGKSIHCAFKWNGQNAVEECACFMMFMREQERQWAILKRHPYLPPPTVSFNLIRGGDSGSTVPDFCDVDMSLHFHPAETENGNIGSAIEREFFAAVKRFCSGNPWLAEHPPEIVCYQRGSGYDIGTDHPIVSCVGRSLLKATGKSPVISGLASGADARLLTNYADTPALICGPGSISNAHSIDEFVELEQYYAAIDLYCEALMGWCGVHEESE